MIFGHLRGWWFRRRYRNLPMSGDTEVADIWVFDDGSEPDPAFLAKEAEKAKATLRGYAEAQKKVGPGDHTAFNAVAASVASALPDGLQVIQGDGCFSVEGSWAVDSEADPQEMAYHVLAFAQQEVIMTTTHPWPAEAGEPPEPLALLEGTTLQLSYEGVLDLPPVSLPPK